MPGKAELWTFAAKVLLERENATLLFDGEKQVWAPKSLLEDHGDGTFTVPQWFAEEKEMV